MGFEPIDVPGWTLKIELGKRNKGFDFGKDKGWIPDPGIFVKNSLTLFGDVWICQTASAGAAAAEFLAQLQGVCSLCLMKTGPAGWTRLSHIEKPAPECHACALLNKIKLGGETELSAPVCALLRDPTTLQHELHRRPTSLSRDDSYTAPSAIDSAGTDAVGDRSIL